MASAAIRTDHFQRRAGLALHSVADSNRATARALGWREDTTSRRRNGHRPNAISRFLEIIYTLASDRETTPFPLLVEAQITAREGMMAGMDKADLVARYWTLQDEKAGALATLSTAEAAFARAKPTEADHAMGQLADAAKAVAEATEEAAAILRLLRSHGVDPRDPEWRT